MARRFDTVLDFSSFSLEELENYHEYVARLIGSLWIMREDAELSAYLRVLHERRNHEG